MFLTGIDVIQNSVAIKKIKDKRLQLLRKEYEIRVVSNSSPSPALHICKYIFNNNEGTNNLYILVLLFVTGE